jgi:hypothetical protein
MRDTVILTTLESDIGGIVVPGQPEQKRCMISHLNRKKLDVVHLSSQLHGEA